jgi:hypothetical protein
MAVRIERLDQFPKMGLKGRYIGHGYPLCSDIPERAFFETWSKIQALGENSAS